MSATPIIDRAVAGLEKIASLTSATGFLLGVIVGAGFALFGWYWLRRKGLRVMQDPKE